MLLVMPVSLDEIRTRLKRRYGDVRRLGPKDAYEQVLYECACYLVDDARREQVWRRLKQEIGVAPEALLDVPASRLTKVIEAGGMKPPMRAEKLRTCAELAQEIGLPELRRAVREDPVQARKLLRKFPGIGEPSAERILLVAGGWPGLGLESNGLRVLQRLGWSREQKDWNRMWKEVNAAIAPQLGKDGERLYALHSLLRHLGQELCRAAEPRCANCPLLETCPTGQAAS
jgi:endonuclease III